MEDLSLAVVLTAGGATASAAIITGLIAMSKRLVGLGPWIDDNKEPTIAFVLSAILVVIAYVATGAPYDIAGIFGAFLAWYGIATISMGVHDGVSTLAARNNPTP